MKATHGERLAALEAVVPRVETRLTDMDGKLDTLLEAHNRQKGAAKLLALLWAGLIGLGGVIGGLFVGKHG